MDEPAVTLTTHVGETRSVASDPRTLVGEYQADLLRTGDRVGRYVIDAPVGAGGMGRIYAAHDPELDRKVALKLLRAERDDEEGRDRLLREARALAKLSHPHVVAVHDVGAVGNRVFVAMELVSGTTLDKVLAQRPRRWREVLDLMIPVAQGLAAVHAAGLVHRDLKPANIMLGDDGRVRLMDFGLARAPVTAGDEDGDPGSEESALTRTGMRMGTPPYMAPEQWHGELADARTDQFALCVTTWEALYGERPFPGRSPLQLERDITCGKVATPARPSRVPRWLHRVLLRGLSVDPAERHPSIDVLIERLVRGRRRVRSKWIAAFAALSAAVAVGIGLGVTVETEARVARALPEPLEACGPNEVCALGPFEIPVCTLSDGEPASERLPCTPGGDDVCPERESCVTIERNGIDHSQCLPVCAVADDRPHCVPGCYNQQCAGKFDLCSREHGTCGAVPCTRDDQCAPLATCDFPLRGNPGFHCNTDAGYCERTRS